MSFRTILSLSLVFILFATSEASARISGGTRATLSGVTHSAANVSASITTDVIDAGTYTLRFFLRAPGASTGIFISASPSSIPSNGNTTTVFTGVLNGLSCGTAYEVTGAYTDSEGNSYTITPAPSYSLFSTLPCALLTPSSTSAKVFVGNELSPLTFTSTNFNGVPSFQISPSLPAGLSFEPSTGRVSGTPRTVKAATRYTINASGAISGTASADFTLTVAPVLTDLDALRYVASQPDLIDIFGTDIARARQHYLDWGFNEGRKITFEPLLYTASHPDLIETFGLDETESVTHYIRWGYKERRQITFTELQSLRYIASHPDLIEALGPDPRKGARHYIQWGYKEGRLITFNPLEYTASHFDLIDAFGVDEQRAATHYIQWGYREKRQITFRPIDALNYIASSFDLIAAFGTDIAAGTRHYVQWGFKEGRKIVFDAMTYIASHFDLITEFGSDAIAGATHYINWGFKEGRRITFDALGYLAAHFDLRAAFGANTAAATKHYIDWGYKEGRNYLWTVSVVAGPGGQVSTTRMYANNGERLSLTATPQAGYTVNSVTGCGGSLSETTYTTAPITGTCSINASFKLITIPGALTVDCVGAHCAAVNSNTYAGSGVGVWRYANTSTTTPALVDISLTGVKAGNTVTLLFSNGRKVSAPTLPGGGVAPSVPPALGADLRQPSFDLTGSDQAAKPHDEAHLRILESNRKIIESLVGSSKLTAQAKPTIKYATPSEPSPVPEIGSQKVWKDSAFGTSVSYTTSARATCTTGRGRNIVFWVDEPTWSSGKVTSDLVEKFKTTYCGATGGYERLVKLYGEPWGSHSFSTLISDSPNLQDLNIVMVPSDDNYGGYFWGENAFKDDAKSNSALVFFINAKYFSGNSTPTNITNYYISTLIHEMMHMVNFYQRSIRRGSTHDSWLEETSAMMSEDIITPTLIGTNKIETERLPEYLRSGGNVSYINWSQLSGEHYAIGGTFGAFMNRRYGLRFFRSLQTCGNDSYGCVDSFINLNGGESFSSEFSRMGASIFSLVPSSSSPSRYGFQGSSDEGYELKPFDLSAITHLRPKSGAGLSAGYRATSQTFLADAIAIGQSAYVRNGVLVPAGTSLTVVVK